MAKLFLSYSRKNARQAERFTRWLESEGHDVWRDEDDIGGGASFSREIEHALNDCDAVPADRVVKADVFRTAVVAEQRNVTHRVISHGSRHRHEATVPPPHGPL